MAQPTNPLIVWASDDVILPNAQRPNKSLPSESLIKTGWDLSQKPAADEWNYLLNNNGQYIKWLIEEKINEFLKKSENLSDLANKATARTNLSVYSKAESDASFLDAASNLSDLNNVATARTNLNVYSKTETDNNFLDAASNLTDLANTTTARTNLDVFSKSEVNSKTISAGNGLTGGGDLSANRTISMGTPSTVGQATSNTASGTTHTHALDVTSNVAVLTGTIAHGGTIPLPSGYTEAQCKYTAFPATIGATTADGDFSVTLSGRVVSINVDGVTSATSSAGYIIIGVK